MQPPPMIRTDESNAFAHHSMRVRVPGILDETLDLNPDYPPGIRAALAHLRDDLRADAPIPMLDLPAPDYSMWQTAYEAHPGATWLGAEWFFAETFCYRHVIQAVRWWETRRDPFYPKKEQEYNSDALWSLLGQALETDGAPDERLHQLLAFTLWGNRIDLSFAASMAHGGESGHEDDLLVDDRDAAVRQVIGGDGVVHVVADNAGTELALDLALIDGLLDVGVETVMLHLKMHPTFVSDATVTDYWHFIDLLRRRGGALHDLADRLVAALEDGRLRLAPDLYWNSSLVLRDMPGPIRQLFSGSRLVIIKGDANYRRLADDAIWPPDLPFSEMVAYFPAPVLALRTLKSDPITGLPSGLAEKLDADDPDWRTTGRRGVIQVKGE